MNTRSPLPRLIALLATVIVLTIGCTGPERPATAVELVWATGQTTAAAALDVAALWNERHPDGPRVRVEKLPPGTDEQRQLLALELNAGLPTFDVLGLDVIWTGEFAEQGWLLSLDGLRPELEAATLPGPLQTATWDETLWAAPYITDAGLLYYRTDLVTEPPKSWAELMEVGNRVAQEQNIAPFVADGQQYEGLTVQFLEYLWGAGGDLLGADNSTVVLGEDPTLQALEFMRTAYETGFYAPGYDSMSLDDARMTFQSGGAVFMRSWPYAYRSLNGDGSAVAGHVGIAALPNRDGTGSVSALGGNNLAVSSYSRNPDQATEFVRFVATSPEVQRLLAQQPHSLAPALRSTYDELSSDPLIAFLARTLPQARSRPASPEWPAISEEIQQQVFATYHGLQEPDATFVKLRSVLESTTEPR